MRYSNLHTHTTYSDGQHSIEENILSAIAKNMVSLGFSDHSCTDFDLRYCMQPEKVVEEKQQTLEEKKIEAKEVEDFDLEK